jgi:hypothetical protein
MVRKINDGKKIGEIVPRRNASQGKSLRNTINDEMKRGSTHTEMTINFLKKGKNNVNVNPSYYNSDTVIAKYVTKNKVSKENETTLIEASKMDDKINSSNHQAFSIHAYVASQLYYPEITNSNVNEMDKENVEKHIEKIHSGIDDILNQKNGEHETYIAKYTDKIITEASKIRKMAKESSIDKLISNKNIIKKLNEKGYVFVKIENNEYVDSHSLTLAANPDEKMFVFLKGDRVILRAVNGKIKNGLYKTLNDEENKYRKETKNQIDSWNGSQKSGGSPIDGTKIPFERIALILSLY